MIRQYSHPVKIPPIIPPNTTNPELNVSIINPGSSAIDFHSVIQNRIFAAKKPPSRHHRIIGKIWSLSRLCFLALYSAVRQPATIPIAIIRPYPYTVNGPMVRSSFFICLLLKSHFQLHAEKIPTIVHSHNHLMHCFRSRQHHTLRRYPHPESPEANTNLSYPLLYIW